MAISGAALLLALSGCGGADQQSVASAAPAAYLSGGGSELEREIASTFRAHLYRLAVMTQAGDDASDLGQSLPTGKVRGVACSPSGKKPASGDWRWRCTVRWRTVDGESQKTAYSVQITGAGCVYALADPSLRQIHDATTKAPGEHPLNSLVVPKKAC